MKLTNTKSETRAEGKYLLIHHHIY